MSAWTYKVQALVNVGPNVFHEYRREDPLAWVTDRATDEPITFILTASDALGAAEGMYVVGNKMAGDHNGLRWPSDIRSLSISDVVVVQRIDGTDRLVAACGEGWDTIAVDTTDVPNPIVPIEGSQGTSRK